MIDWLVAEVHLAVHSRSVLKSFGTTFDSVFVELRTPNAAIPAGRLRCPDDLIGILTPGCIHGSSREC